MYWGLNNGQSPSDAEVIAAGLPALINNANVADLKPLYYAAGSSDYLVPPEDAPGRPGQGQGEPLRDAYTNKGLLSDFYWKWHVEALHYQMPERYESDDLFEFIKIL